jgi:hypothetical protein
MLSVLLMIMVVVAACAGTGLAGSEVPLWTVSELKLRLNDPDLVILDVRRGNDWTSSDAKIKGAVYADPAAYDEWAADYPKNQLLILYCA